MLFSGVLQNGSWAYLGKEKYAFHFSFSKTAGDRMQWTPQDFQGIAGSTAAGCASHTIPLSAHLDEMMHDSYLSIQGNPKADFLE